MSVRARRLAPWLLCSLSLSCGSEDPIQGDPSNPGWVDGGVGLDGGALPGDAGYFPGDAGFFPGDGSALPDADFDFEGCAGEVIEAEQQVKPVNVVWVVDSSGSMRDESQRVSDNLNAFATRIASGGIAAYRVVIVTDQNQGWLNVPDPLGSDTTHLLYVNESVGSDEPLSDLIKTFDRYRPFLLQDAVTHFVVVTDDESELSSADFLSQMRQRLGNAPFKVHAVASEANGCFLGLCVPCSGASGVGAHHYAAADATGGIKFSICSADWSGLFDQLGQAVSAPVPCELAVPPAPEGQTLDRDKVNVLFTAPNASAATPFPRVSTPDACGNTAGWYYAPNQADRIALCPNSCSAVEQGGKLELKLGCGTVTVLE